jgi:hypothetical protein
MAEETGVRMIRWVNPICRKTSFSRPMPSPPRGQTQHLNQIFDWSRCSLIVGGKTYESLGVKMI